MNRAIVTIMASLIGYIFICPPEHDLSRYYDMVEIFDTDTALIEFINSQIERNLDFIYFTFLFLSKKLDLAKELVNGFFVGLFFNQIFLILELLSRKALTNSQPKYLILIKLFCLFSTPIIYILSISRTVAAISFFFIAINQLLKERKFFFYIFTIISVFTHIGMILNILIFLVIYNFNVFRISHKNTRNWLLLLSTIVGLTSKFWITPINDFVGSLPFFNSYERYLGMLENNNTSLYDGVTPYYDLIPILSSVLLLFIGLNRLTKYSNLTWVTYYYFIILTIYAGFSCSLLQRLLMLSIPLQGYIALSVLSTEKNYFFLTTYKILITFTIIIFFMNVYTYREFLLNPYGTRFNR